MSFRSYLWYGLGLSLVAGVVLLVRERVERSVREARFTVAQLRSTAESVPDGALYQRFHLRRAAVDSMRAALRDLVAAESAFVVDSGHPSAVLPQAYWHRPMGDNIGPSIRITPNGWYATINNRYTAITCGVVVGPDTSFGTAKSGEPVCFSP